jgi:hypothetical protein
MFRVALLVALVAGCTADPGASAFKAATDEDAGHVVAAFLDGAQAKDVARVAAQVCDDDKGKAAAAVAGPLAITGYSITRIEPAWVGGEPYFKVDVDLVKGAAHDGRSLAVRARDGCVDRLLGEPLETARQPSGEIAL